MKFLFYVVGLGLALWVGLYPAIEKKRPLYTKFLTIFCITAVVVLALYPPTIGTLGDAVRARELKLENREINVLIVPDLSKADTAFCVRQINPDNGREIQIQFAGKEMVDIAAGLGAGKELVLRLSNEDSHDRFVVHEVLGIKPAIILPYIPALEERARILYFHVPMSWVGFLAFFVTLVCSVAFLRTNNYKWETKAVASAGIGTLFTALAYITGALWAKFNWGKFFNWDSRELSVLILLLIYAAYFALRSSIDERERRARLSSVYAIISCVAALFLMFIVPRITDSLHPGSQGDVNSGPIISPQADAINTTKALIFSLSLSGFTMLYFWILSLRVRIMNVANVLDRRSIGS